jgi:hypothetical protein
LLDCTVWDVELLCVTEQPWEDLVYHEFCFHDYCMYFC